MFRNYNGEMILGLKIGAIQKYIVLGTIITYFFITPGYSRDPINLARMVPLVIIGVSLFALSILHIRKFVEQKLTNILILISIFLMQAILVCFFSGAEKTQQFYGVLGRNTGILTYIALSGFLICSVLVSNIFHARFLFWSLAGSGFVTILYNGLQYFGADPVSWNNSHSELIGFLGNPNFNSSFLGIASAALITLILYPNFNIKHRVFATGLQLLALFLMWDSHSEQGLMVFISEVSAIILYIGFKRIKTKRYFYTLTIFFFIGFVAIIAGILNHGPLRSYLTRASIHERGYWWHAAIAMIKDNPFFGVGIDSFGDNYFKFRSQKAIDLSLEPGSNSAHNIFLDLASTGGLILCISYVAIVATAFILIVKTMKEQEVISPYFVGLSLAFLGYQVQSLISIQHIGLAIWGWVLCGTIIGLSVRIRQEGKIAPNNKFKYSGVTSIIGAIFGSVLVLPYFVTDHNYLVSVTSGNPFKIASASLQEPKDVRRVMLASLYAAQVNESELSLALAKKVARINRNNYDAWYNINILSEKDSVDYKESISNLRRLNPLEPKFFKK
jgi:O-antigen ligase